MKFLQTTNTNNDYKNDSYMIGADEMPYQYK